MPWRDAWTVFSGAVLRRLGNGHRDYGDRSFHRHPIELLDEVQEELLDVNGWSFILWKRLQGVRRGLACWRCPHCGKPVDLTEAAASEVFDPPREQEIEV